MDKFTFSRRSLTNLRGIHPHLQAVAARALQLSEVDFIVTCGVRSQDEQRRLVEIGKSWTMNSRHLTGHAIDVVAYVNGDISWRSADYVKIADAFKQAAKEYGIPLRWGGDWDRDGDHKDERNFDGPHFELERRDYPAAEPHAAPAPVEDWPEDLRELLRIGDPVSPVKLPEAVPVIAKRRARMFAR